MYKNLSGKKLLVLGSDYADCIIVETAQSLGVYVIAADGKTPGTNTPAKLAANEARQIDYSDTDALESMCRAAAIDGVLASFSEIRVLYACLLADRLGLPFYAAREQLEITGNKRMF